MYASKADSIRSSRQIQGPKCARNNDAPQHDALLPGNRPRAFAYRIAKLGTDGLLFQRQIGTIIHYYDIL
jgi:hypothetical protein